MIVINAIEIVIYFISYCIVFLLKFHRIRSLKGSAPAASSLWRQGFLDNTLADRHVVVADA